MAVGRRGWKKQKSENSRIHRQLKKIHYFGVKYATKAANTMILEGQSSPILAIGSPRCKLV